MTEDEHRMKNKFVALRGVRFQNATRRNYKSRKDNFVFLERDYSLMAYLLFSLGDQCSMDFRENIDN